MSLTLQAVTPENTPSVLSLQVKPHQIHLIESPLECLQEAAENAEWRPFAILKDNTPVGFAMYGYLVNEQTLWMDRLLIDERYQGLHYGEQALLLLLERIREEYPHIPTVTLSVYGDNLPAIRLYQKHGFRFNGKLDTKGERIMTRPNQTTTQ